MSQFTDLTAYEVSNRPRPSGVSRSRTTSTSGSAARRRRHRHHLAQRLRSVADRLDV
ncbi:MAG: hypothetical protein WB767_04300 [Nocardioides sp.]